jgi:hypothetical protein
VVSGYFVWVQGLSIVPEELWRELSSTRDEASLFDIPLFIWSLIVVALTALPLGLLNGSISAVLILRRQGEESTLYKCLAAASLHTLRIWSFSFIDSWITVKQIFDRLPKSSRDRGLYIDDTVTKELLYYAWKVGTMGYLPALLYGNDVVEASKKSLSLVKNKLNEVAMLRIGYSFFCWIIGIGSYIFCFYFLAQFDLKEFDFYRAYVLAGFPIAIAVSVVSIFLSPVYMIAATELYLDNEKENGEELLKMDQTESSSSLLFTGIIFIVFALFVLYVWTKLRLVFV